MTLAACRAVLFDLDGLLIDSERPAVRLWCRAAAERGYSIPESVPIATVGLNESDTRDVIMVHCGAAFPYEAVRDRMEELYAAEVENGGLAPRPGVTELLARLDAVGMARAIATSSARAAANYKLDRSGLGNIFPVLACGDETARGKPAPDIFLLAAARLGVVPRDCIGFEDSPAGLAALRAADIRSVFIKDLVEPPAGILATVWRRYERADQAVELFG